MQFLLINSKIQYSLAHTTSWLYTKKMNKRINIYTDGAAKGNPGNGGWAFLMTEGVDEMLLSYGSVKNTTNNRMEMTAFINALERAKDSKLMHVDVYTDSKYIEQTINKGWLIKWISESFRGKKNVDLWCRIYGLLVQMDVRVIWVKGHSSDPYNSLVDFYASSVAETDITSADSIIRFKKQ